MRQFLIALFIALIALPAAAAESRCTSLVMATDHGMTTASSVEHGHASHQSPAVPDHQAGHDCIGCIAPIDKSQYRAATEPLHFAGSVTAVPLVSGLCSWLTTPESPPPKHHS